MDIERGRGGPSDHEIRKNPPELLTNEELDELGADPGIDAHPDDEPSVPLANGSIGGHHVVGEEPTPAQKILMNTKPLTAEELALHELKVREAEAARQAERVRIREINGKAGWVSETAAGILKEIDETLEKAPENITQDLLDVARLCVERMKEVLFDSVEGSTPTENNDQDLSDQVARARELARTIALDIRHNSPTTITVEELDYILATVTALEDSIFEKA